MSTSRLIRTTLLLLALALVAAACGGGSGFQGEQGGDQAEGGGAEGAGELELAGFASSPAEDEQLTSILEQYGEQTGTTVTFSPSPDYDTTLQAALAGGEPPDVFYVNDNRIPDLVEAGTLAPMEDNVEGADDFYPNLLESFTVDGTVYCPPKDFSTLALQYNEDMLAEAGVEPPTTWEELRAAAEALTTGDRVGLTLGPEYFRWGVFAEQAGGGITNDDLTEMTAATDPNRTAFSYLQEMFDAGFAATPSDLDAGWAGEAFGLERAAMTVEGNWMVASMNNDYPDLNWASAELPAGPEGKATFSFSVCYAVATNAPNPEASWDLVNYLVSPEAQLEFTQNFPVIPSRQSLADQWLEANPDLQPYVDAAEYAQPVTFVPGFQAVLDTLNDGIQGISTGNRQVDEVLEATDEAGQGLLGG
jgi:multiple sugar transport system substrate-binding protein